jgi:Skp family chaperone for outer membrane proteins
MEESGMTVVVRRLVAGLVFCLLTAVSTGSAQAPAGGAGAPSVGGRIAFINARALLQGMPGYTRAESLYTKDLGAAQAEGQRLQAAWDSTVAAYQQSQAMLSPSARTAREKALGVQNDSLQAKLQALQDRVGGRERELLAPMQQRLTAIIDGIRAEGNYWLVIDLGNPQIGGFIVSYDKSLDITDRVARRLLQSN